MRALHAPVAAQRCSFDHKYVLLSFAPRAGRVRCLSGEGAADSAAALFATQPQSQQVWRLIDNGQFDMVDAAIAAHLQALREQAQADAAASAAPAAPTAPFNSPKLTQSGEGNADASNIVEDKFAAGLRMRIAALKAKEQAAAARELLLAHIACRMALRGAALAWQVRLMLTKPSIAVCIVAHLRCVIPV